MIALVQRVRRSWVEVDGIRVAEITHGVNCLLGVQKGDTRKEAEWLADKVVNLRIFEDENGKMNRSLMDIKGSIIVVPQFTLVADCIKGRRPSFSKAADYVMAEDMFNYFVDYITERYGITVAKGVFRAHMHVYIENDGPVTFIINTKEKFKDEI